MSDPAPIRKLAAILVTDLVGFSKKMGEDENRTLRNLKACRVIIDDAIAGNHGRIFGSAGDSVIAEFASPVDALVAAPREEAARLGGENRFPVLLLLGQPALQEVAVVTGRYYVRSRYIGSHRTLGSVREKFATTRAGAYLSVKKDRRHEIQQLRLHTLL